MNEVLLSWSMPGDEGRVPPVAKRVWEQVFSCQRENRKIKILIKLRVGQRHTASCADQENGELPCQKGLLGFNPNQQPSPMQLLTQSSTVAVDLSLGVEKSQDTLNMKRVPVDSSL